jgi:hypothetical protein
MANKTRDGILNQKRGVSVAVIPFVEADILTTGSIYVTLPKRSLITRIVSNITTASGTGSATVDVEANGTVIVNELAVAAANVTDETLVAAAQYLATGGDIEILAGATTPADGALIGELIVEYIELDKTNGEYTTIEQTS